MSSERIGSLLDSHLRLRLADLSSGDFERFFLHFFSAGISLEIIRNGAPVSRRIIEATTYAAGSGREQDGIDLMAKVEGGETWVFQCKRRKSWNVSRTELAIEKAKQFQANHYFLLVACDPHKDVQTLIDAHPKWSFWNLDKICSEFRLRVPKEQQPKVLYFLSREELQRFAPYTTGAFISPAEYFAAAQRANHSFHHRYGLVGREKELKKIRQFTTEATDKVLVVSAKGGEGKTRLLFETTEFVAREKPDTEILFLNPHSSADIPVDLWDRSRPRLLLVDDAHRIERVSHELLTCVRESEATKLILATRPQGNEALDARLLEHGFRDWPAFELASLKKADVTTLARDALGPTMAVNAEALVSRTGQSPFLTALAGDLLRRKQLRWDDWSNDREFRSAVFRSFEKDNLSHLAPTDQQHGGQLLRIIALLAPVDADPVFHSNVATCLGISAVDAEALLQRLQAAGAVSAQARKLRIIPDLFSDFLVFDTAFVPKHRLPTLARSVLTEFKEQGPALLRNLAEATWIARSESIPRDDLLRPLLEAEFARFDRLDHFEQGHVLEHWATFSIYLPKESLELAQRALARAGPGGAMRDDDGIRSPGYLRSWIPALVKPVAKWHDEYRHQTLDLLWTLGIDTPKGILGVNQNHPWAVIAEVLKFEPRKPIAIVESALTWAEGWVRRDNVQGLLGSRLAILHTLLAPCFARQVEFTSWEGRTVRWWHVGVDVARTTPLRDRALGIIAWVIEHGSWRARLDAVGALEPALRRVAGMETDNAAHPDKLRSEWRPERLKALALLSRLLELESHPFVRLGVRRLLWRDLAYEEDAEFAERARAVVRTVREDFDLDLAAVLTSHGHFEFIEELGPPRAKEIAGKIEERWTEKIRAMAQQFIAHCPTAESAVARLEVTVAAAEEASETVFVGRFFPTLAEIDPTYAEALAREFLRAEATTKIAVHWHNLLYGFTEPAIPARLIFEAQRNPRTAIRAGIIQFLRFRARKGPGLSPEEKWIVEALAANAELAEVATMVDLVAWVNASDVAWAYSLLEKLPLAEFARRHTSEILRALVPYEAREVDPPLTTVQHALRAMVDVAELPLDGAAREFTQLAERYPRAMYDFVLERLKHYESLPDETRYDAVPGGYRLSFRLNRLAQDPDFAAICDFLWEKANSDPATKNHFNWRRLFQALVIEQEVYWRPKLLAAIDRATTLDAIYHLIQLIHFEGSLVIFRMPEVAAAFLRRAEAVGGVDGFKEMRSNLYHATGPGGRGYTNGELNKDDDYVEAEAIKAAEAHATDPVLGPFFRWIVEREKHDREWNRRRFALDVESED